MATVSTDDGAFKSLPSIYAKLAEAKATKGLTFEQLGNAIGKSEVYTAAAFYGQAKLEDGEITALANALGIDSASIQAELGSHWFPHRGMEMPPKDPLIYRIYEGVMVYGEPIKAVIHEKFGDGIMSMIDCTVDIQKKPDPKGDRVLLTFDGKFLPYKRW